MGFVLILILVILIVMFFYLFFKKISGKYYYTYLRVVIVAGSIVSMLLIWYYIPFYPQLPVNPVYQIEIGTETIWITDPEDTQTICGILGELRLQRETISTGEILPVDRVTKKPLRTGEATIITVYDADDVIDGLPKKCGWFFFAFPYAHICRYIPADRTFFGDCRILNAEKYMPDIIQLYDQYCGVG